MNTNITTMKNIFTTAFIFCASLMFSQTEVSEKRMIDLTRLKISDGVSLHIIAPEPIQFVDLSTESLTGDLPSENIARVKITDENAIVTDSVYFKPKTVDKSNLGVITVVCQSFMAQYKVDYIDYGSDAVTNIQIQPEDMQPLEYPKMNFSNLELRKFAVDILRKNKLDTPIREVKDLKLSMQLNNVYVLEDYIFLDMTINNFSNLKYDIDAIKFSVEDKKIYKATNNQSIELEPVFTLADSKQFRKKHRNIYVFKKFTYPNSKILKIRLIEEQLSGRTIEMIVKYSDILKADTF
ncbi:MAG: conjugative transposon protein TraN [Bergeyella sp.]